MKISFLLTLEAYATSSITPAIVLGSYVLCTESADNLGVAELIAVLAVIMLICGPLSTVYVCVPFFAVKLLGFMRIQEHLMLDEMADDRVLAPSDARPGNVVEIENVSIGVSPHKTILNRISLKFPVSCVSVIIGTIGCGKSTLLKGFIG